MSTAPAGRSSRATSAGSESPAPRSRSRRLSEPRPADVRAGPGGAPAALAGREVDAVREEWVVEDRWWTSRPLRRRYFELVLADGRNVVVFRDLVGGRWFVQRA